MRATGQLPSEDIKEAGNLGGAGIEETLAIEMRLHRFHLRMLCFDRASTPSGSVAHWSVGMRIAVVSDVHGNLTALEAVIADLRTAAPDLVLHGGDLPHGGSSPSTVVDRIRDLGWQGVLGNTDEMLFRPESLTEFAAGLPQLKSMFDVIEEMAAATREALGADRMEWLRGLPMRQVHGPMALVHASPESTWRSPGPESPDAELESAYSPLGRPVAVYGHVHRSFVRALSGITVVNTGSVSLSFDGDPRAAYLLLDDDVPTIRRVEYDVEREAKVLASCGLPHSDWVARGLRSARPEMP
jgi:putative phosphoesterase